MAMYGADVAELRTLATQFDHAADRLDSCRTQLGSQLQSTQWSGPDSGRFRGEWSGAHVQRLTGAATQLRDAARRLRANADEQEGASRANVSGRSESSGLGGLSNGGFAERFFQSAKEFYGDVLPNSVQGLIDAIKDPKIIGDLSVWDGLNALAGGSKLVGVDVPGLSGLGLGMDTVSWANEIRQGTFDGFDAIDAAAAALKIAPNPVAKLGAVALSAGSYAGQQAMQADFSSETWNNNMSYISKNPAALVEEVGEAVLTVGTKAIGWLF